MDDLKFNPIARIAPPGQRERPAQKRQRRKQFLAMELHALTRLPVDDVIGRIVLVGVSTGNLDKLPGLGHGKSIQTQRQPVMFSTDRVVLSDASDKLLSRG